MACDGIPLEFHIDFGFHPPLRERDCPIVAHSEGSPFRVIASNFLGHMRTVTAATDKAEDERTYQTGKERPRQESNLRPKD